MLSYSKNADFLYQAIQESLFRVASISELIHVFHAFIDEWSSVEATRKNL